jgi:hypothetical protein
MHDKKAVTILMNLLDKHTLNDEEKEAVRAAIGILSRSSLSKSRIKARKVRLDKDTKWQ